MYFLSKHSPSGSISPFINFSHSLWFGFTTISHASSSWKGYLSFPAATSYDPIISQAVLSLAIHHLVGAQPLAHLVEFRVVVLEKVAIVSQRFANRVLHIHSQHLPVHLSLVDQRNGSEHLDLVHVPQLVRDIAEVHDVQRIVVTMERPDVRQLVSVRVLPGLGNGTIVNHRRSTVET